MNFNVIIRFDQNQQKNSISDILRKFAKELNIQSFINSIILQKQKQLQQFQIYQISKMSQSTATESQSYSLSANEKTSAQSQSQTTSNKCSQEQIQKLAESMKKVEGAEFQDCLRQLSFLLKQRLAKKFIKHSLVMRKIMNHFTKLSKSLQKENHEQQVQIKMLASLSVIAEIIKQSPKVFFPFTRKFLTNVFLIDENLLIASPHRRNILAILGVIYENLSRQLRLLQKYQMIDILKNNLLKFYGLIDQIFTLKIFNKSIFNLVQNGVIFTNQQLMNNQIYNTVALLMPVQSLFLQQKINKTGFESKRQELIQITQSQTMIAQ